MSTITCGINQEQLQAKTNTMLNNFSLSNANMHPTWSSSFEKTTRIRLQIGIPAQWVSHLLQTCFLAFELEKIFQIHKIDISLAQDLRQETPQL